MQKLSDLLATVKKLRAPNGCPWDRDQTHETLKPYVIEEAYEVLEAIDSHNPQKIKDELGDLLLQVVLHAEIADENKEFNFFDIAENINQKLIRRHPHVFAETKVNGVAEVWQNWEQIKKNEKKETAESSQSSLKSVPASLPALYRATKLQKKAARLGFDWPDNQGVFAKIREELDEFTQEIEKKETSPKKVMEEFGDILFSLVNLSRKLDFDAEDALRLANKKFSARFAFVEKKVAQCGKTLKDFSLAELDQFWDAAKKTVTI